MRSRNHLKAHQLVRKGVFSSTILSQLRRPIMSSNFHRFVILCIYYVEIHQVRTLTITGGGCPVYFTIRTELLTLLLLLNSGRYSPYGFIHMHSACLSNFLYFRDVNKIPRAPEHFTTFWIVTAAAFLNWDTKIADGIHFSSVVHNCTDKQSVQYSKQHGINKWE